jgi:hypothetical protein
MADIVQQEERRQFSRILFNADCVLHQGEEEWTSELLDISLNGILIKHKDQINVNRLKPCEAVINLANSESSIVMAIIFSHADETSLGFRCEHIDLDSMSHLKRLVELNLGNDELLKRELGALNKN